MGQEHRNTFFQWNITICLPLIVKTDQSHYLKLKTNFDSSFLTEKYFLRRSLNWEQPVTNFNKLLQTLINPPCPAICHLNLDIAEQLLQCFEGNIKWQKFKFILCIVFYKMKIYFLVKFMWETRERRGWMFQQF